MMMNSSLVEPQAETRYIGPKYCSPLKRHPPVEFLFTKADVSAAAQQNKHLIDSIMACLPEVKRHIARPKKKPQPRNTRDAAVQTTKPFCDICDIRDSTQFRSVATSVDAEHFSAAVHTQVLEQELASSKAVFTPSGASDGAQMSIAHLTPAQLVSQLAARAKTLKQSDYPTNQRTPGGNYDYDRDRTYDRGQQYQNNYGNYRY